MLTPPDADRLKAVNDVSIADFPDFALARQEWDHPRVTDLDVTTRAALDDIPALEGLPRGAEVGVTAGSRGIHDKPAVLRTIVSALEDRGYEPFVFPAMGSHGGASAAGQRQMLASLDVTEETVGCEIRSSLDVEHVADDDAGRPVHASTDVLEADAVLLVNRIKAHTDFEGDIESGLCKMAVIGVGKQRGAEHAHNAALEDSFRTVLPERATLLFEETPIVGGVAILENADDRAAEVHGLPADEIVDREPGLLARSKELLPTLPIDDLDLLIVDEIGKNISGTGMDTNLLGRLLVLGEPEPDSPTISRIYVRDLTEPAHGNGIGVGLADFAHERVVGELDLTDTYINSITGGVPERARIPSIMPDDETALLCAYSTTGVRDPGEMRIARIRNTLAVDRVLVSEPLVAECRAADNVTEIHPRPLGISGGDFVENPYEEPAASHDD